MTAILLTRVAWLELLAAAGLNRRKLLIQCAKADPLERFRLRAWLSDRY